MAYGISRAAGLAVALTFFALSGYAQSYVYGPQNSTTIENSRFGVRFDDQGGNTSNWQTESTGNTSAQETGIQNGMTWVHPIDTGDNQSRSGGAENLQIQHSNTGTQVNIDAGEMCVEQGVARTCF